MAVAAPVRSIEVDFSRYGRSAVIHARLFKSERAGLRVGDTVMLCGDTVDDAPFTIAAISADGRDFTFRRAA